MQNRISTSLNNAEFWLLGIAASLIVINLTLVWRRDDPTSFYINFLFFITIYSFLKEKYHILNLQSGILSSLLGILLIAVVFTSSLFQVNIGILFLLLPLISGFGLALLASGYKGLRQYKKEFLVLGFLTIRNLLGLYQPDISLLTAKLSTAILWYTGFKVKRSGIMIHLPTGSIEVYSACSGMDVIIDLLSLAVLFIFMFDINLLQKFIVPIVAAVIAFVVNGFRVSLMGILVAQGNKQAFDGA